MRNFAVHLACYLLKLPLTIQQRTKLVCAILDANNAVPLSDVLTERKGVGLMLNGEPLGYDKAIQLRNSARMALNNQALGHIRNQVASIAGRRGIAEGDTPDKLIFYRAALWWGSMELEVLNTLAAFSESEEV